MGKYENSGHNVTKNGNGEYVKETTNPLGWKMSAEGYQLVFNEQQANPHTITGYSWSQNNSNKCNFHTFIKKICLIMICAIVGVCTLCLPHTGNYGTKCMDIYEILQGSIP